MFLGAFVERQLFQGANDDGFRRTQGQRRVSVLNHIRHCFSPHKELPEAFGCPRMNDKVSDPAQFCHGFPDANEDLVRQRFQAWLRQRPVLEIGFILLVASAAFGPRGTVSILMLLLPATIHHVGAQAGVCQRPNLFEIIRWLDDASSSSTKAYRQLGIDANSQIEPRE